MTLQQTFIASKGEPIQYEGRTLYWTYWLPVMPGDLIAIRFVAATKRPVQGIGIVGVDCLLQVVGSRGKHFALWTDSAPSDVNIHTVKAKQGARLGIFNQWRDTKYGTTLYRLNDAAIELEELESGAVVLHCSDGVGEFNRSDLVVEVSLRKGLMHMTGKT